MYAQQIIENDPLTAWHFMDVNDDIYMSLEGEGKIDDDCISLMKEFAFSSNVDAGTKGSKVPFAMLLIVLGILIVFLMSRMKTQDEMEASVLEKAIDISKEYNTKDREFIKQKLIEDGIDPGYVDTILKKI